MWETIGVTVSKYVTIITGWRQWTIDWELHVEICRHSLQFQHQDRMQIYFVMQLRQTWIKSIFDANTLINWIRYWPFINCHSHGEWLIHVTKQRMVNLTNALGQSYCIENCNEFWTFWFRNIRINYLQINSNYRIIIIGYRDWIYMKFLLPGISENLFNYSVVSIDKRGRTLFTKSFLMAAIT